MEETVNSSLHPSVVWGAWEKIHALHLKESVTKSKIKHKIFDIVPGESFSVAWKSLFVSLIFSYSVKKSPKGSEIYCGAKIKGIFALPVRWMLSGKIKKNLTFTLREFVKQLERQVTT